MLEKQLQQKVIALCSAMGIIARKTNAESNRGFPDLTLITPNGHVLFVELKTKTGRLSRLQERTLAQLKQNNANAYVCRSIAEFKKIIGKYETDTHTHPAGGCQPACP